MRFLKIALILTAFLFACQAQATRGDGKDSKKTAQLNDKGTRESQYGPTTVIEHQTIYSDVARPQEQGKQQQRASPPHDWIDYINACSTAVIAAFTILLFAGVVWQIRTSKTIERAWVMADVEPDSEKWRDHKLHVLEGSGTSGDSTAIYAVLVCTNAGKSPAWINETRAKFAIVETLPLIPNFESAEYIEASTIPLGMVEGGAAPHTQRLPWTPTAVGHEELGKMSVIYGFVKYRDIFKKPHVTTFGYRIIHGQLKRLENYPEYNQNT